LVVLSVGLLVGGCKKHPLRGTETASVDGKTYLVIDDDCGSPVFVDGKRWPQGIHVAGMLSPGLHELACGSAIRGDGLWLEVKPAS
jgi:hypothetical protein